jgi:hypothetical protein
MYAMNLKVNVGLLFAALGYAIVVAIGLLEMNLNVHAPTMLLYMAPVLILIFMEDPNWFGVLVVLAPLNRRYTAAWPLL